MAIIVKQCAVCGKYFETKDDEKIYCSSICEESYQRCSVCGNYYLLEDFYNKEELICSNECSKKYIFNQKKENPNFNLKNL